jgi:hypothetical protein
MLFVKFVVSTLAHLLYWVASATQSVVFQSTKFDLFRPMAVCVLAAFMAAFFLTSFFVEVEGWLRRKHPAYKIYPRDGFSWAMALLVLASSTYMGITTSAATLVAFPIGHTLDPTPILADAFSHGLHSGSAIIPDWHFGAVTSGPAKLFTLCVIAMQALSACLYEPDWVLSSVFPHAKVKYDLRVVDVTSIQMVDTALATTPWLMSFGLFLFNIVLSSIGAAFMSGSDTLLVSTLMWMMVFTIIWFINVGLIFVVVTRQIKLNIYVLENMVDQPLDQFDVNPSEPYAHED